MSVYVMSVPNFAIFWAGKAESEEDAMEQARKDLGGEIEDYEPYGRSWESDYRIWTCCDTKDEIIENFGHCEDVNSLIDMID